MRCKIFNNYTHGSDPWRVWNTTDCKYTLEVLLAGVATKHATEQPMHLNRKETQISRCNSLRNFPLQGFNKHIHRFRCSGKGEHLASEPYRKAESGSQPTRNKCVARSSTTTPMVQIPTGFGMPRNANVPWRHFWQGYPPNTQQNSTCI